MINKKAMSAMFLATMVATGVVSYTVPTAAEAKISESTSHLNLYPAGVFSYTPTPEEEAQWGYRWAFLDKEQTLRKYVYKEHALMQYNQYGPDSDWKGSNKGVFAYKPTPEEDAQWGYRWAFIDKEGKVRKFVKKENADLIYKQIFG
ncbi:hypothetical protein GPJ61_23710 [Brevibacillus formosus]|uniref:hypothetical protein n=1 Tax=Brevibacillus formosus TaxID=54913 RepID=UPI001CA52A01|nr:hypothetical protein [Brevibacillus formosus]MBW5470825.1 hypothetical protein [Brevibacillus formosus]